MKLGLFLKWNFKRERKKKMHDIKGDHLKARIFEVDSKKKNYKQNSLRSFKIEK